MLRGFHGYKTFSLALVVTLCYFGGYWFGQAQAIVVGVPGLLVGLAALVGANEAANVFKERAHSGPQTTVLAETAEVTGEPVVVQQRGAQAPTDAL